MPDHEGGRPLERALWPRTEGRRPPGAAAFGGERPGKVLRRPRGRREDARLVKAAFSNVAFPLAAIEVFHGGRGPEFCDGDVDALLSAFGIERPVSRPGNPCDNAVVESTDRVLKRELVRGRAFPSEDRLRTELFDWVNWYNDYRLHSTLGYMTPAGFREAGLILS